MNRFLEAYARDGYILVFQDVRGRYQSQGRFIHFRPILPDAHDPKAVDESTDTYDTIDWLVKHVPHNNGKVGMSRHELPGTYAAMGLVRSHPALKAVSPRQAPDDRLVRRGRHAPQRSAPVRIIFYGNLHRDVLGQMNQHPAKDIPLAAMGSLWGRDG